jgi:hypothetical protein
MKNKRFFAGMLALMLVFGLIAMGCDNGTTPGGQVTKFEGTWVNSGENWELTYKFTGNQVEYSSHTGSRWSATFTFTDTEITFSSERGDSWTQVYSLSEGTLIITSDDKHPYGTFQKQN